MLTAFVRFYRLLGGAVFSAAVVAALMLSFSAFEAAAADEVVAELEPGLYRYASGVIGMKPVADHPDDRSASDVSAVAAVVDEADPVVHGEKHCLATAIYFEARGESAKGQKAVAEVIVARTRTPGRPKTICGVVYEGSERKTGCQFSFTCDGAADIARAGSQWTRAQRIAGAVITMGRKARTVSRVATFYHADYVKPVWASRMVRVAQIGSHIFYRPKRGRLL